MRAALCFALALATGCSKSDDDLAWEAHQAQVKKDVAKGLPPADPSEPPEPMTPAWYGLPDAGYDGWFGSGMNEVFHRPSWDAQRRLEREMLAKGAITLGFSIGAAPASDLAVDTLLRAASDADWNLRARALHILADVPSLGQRPDARDKILPAAGAALRDPHPVVRAAAAWAVGRLLDEAPGDKTFAAADLTKLLKDPEFFTRHNAAVSLARLGIAPDEAVDVLRAHLKHDNWWIIAGAAAGLYRMGPRAKAAVPELRRILTHPVDTCRSNAQAALEAIEPPK